MNILFLSINLVYGILKTSQGGIAETLLILSRVFSPPLPYLKIITKIPNRQLRIFFIFPESSTWKVLQKMELMLGW